MRLIPAALSGVFLFAWGLPILLGWARDAWDSPDYGHLIPLSILLILVGLGRTLRSSPGEIGEGPPPDLPRWWWITFIVGIGLAVLGELASEWFTRRAGFVLLVTAWLPILAPRHSRAWTAPALAHLALIPWPYVVYYGLTARLQLISTGFAARGLSLLGVPLVRDGNLLHLPGYDLEVVEACSGLRGILVLSSIAVVVWVFHRLDWRRGALLVVISLPLALFANTIRLVGAGVASRLQGPDAADGWFHTTEGVVTFVGGALVLGLVAAALRRGEPS